MQGTADWQEKKPDCAKSHTESAEQIAAFSVDLMSLWGLGSVAQSVARFDPDTGEKINKMRKSYEGQIKSLGLSGRSKALRYDDIFKYRGMPLSLSEMAQWPQEEWDNQKLRGHDAMNSIRAAGRDVILKAMDLQPGRLPEETKWLNILGLDRSKAESHGTDTPSSRQASDSKVPRTARSRRNVKKRRYDDGSYEGYGEGFVDDDGDTDHGYESGETLVSVDSRGERKRRRIRLA